MPTRHGGNCATSSLSFARDSVRRTTVAPCQSTACTENTFFAKSIPTVGNYAHGASPLQRMDLATQSRHLGVTSGRGSPSHSLDGMKRRRSAPCARRPGRCVRLSAKLMRPFLIIFSCVIVTGCASGFSAALVGMMTPGPRGPVSDIRVRNASSVALRDVIVGRVRYGDIGAGEHTDYKPWGPAYPHPIVRFEMGGIHLRQVPLYHFGEKVLGTGKFTYILTVATPKSKSDFSVTVVKDEGMPSNGHWSGL